MTLTMTPRKARQKVTLSSDTLGCLVTKLFQSHVSHCKMCTDRPATSGGECGSPSSSADQRTASGGDDAHARAVPPMTSAGYGYGGRIDAMRRDEFSRLEGADGGGPNTLLDTLEP
jgi:hypothetical protein